MANRHRGEVAVTLAGRSYTMRPTFTALAEIEDRTGCGLLGLLHRLRDHSVKDTCSVIYCGIKATDPKADEEEICGLVVETGVNNLIEAMMDFVEMALYGMGEETEKKTRDA